MYGISYLSNFCELFSEVQLLTERTFAHMYITIMLIIMVRCSYTLSMTYALSFAVRIPPQHSSFSKSFIFSSLTSGLVHIQTYISIKQNKFTWTQSLHNSMKNYIVQKMVSVQKLFIMLAPRCSFANNINRPITHLFMKCYVCAKFQGLIVFGYWVTYIGWIWKRREEFVLFI